MARINTQEPLRYEIIGVVEHQRHASLARDGREAIFAADGYFNYGPANRWAVRTTGDPMAIAAQARMWAGSELWTWAFVSRTVLMLTLPGVFFALYFHASEFKLLYRFATTRE